MLGKYDLIVIGAGNGGLMTACRAARMGLKTLVLEKHNLPGGAASSFVRGRFEFDSALHELPDFGAGEHRGGLGRLFDELGVQVEMLPVPDAFRYVCKRNGETLLDVTMPHGREAVFDFIARECPDDRDAMEKLFAAAEDMERGLAYFGSTRGNLDLEELQRNHANFMRILSLSAGEFFDAIGMSRRCQDILSAYWPYQGADIDTVDASRLILMIKGYLLNGAFIPKYRAHQLSVAIMKRARELGAEFHFNAEVTKLLTKNGAVDGVETSDGKRYRAIAVASNAFPELIYSKLLDNKKLVPKFELQKVNARSYSFRGFCVYLGLDASPEELGIKDYSIFITSSLDTRELYRNCAGQNAADYQLVALCLNIANPDCSPAGTSILTLTVSFTADAWADVTKEDYVKAKRRIADHMISVYEEKIGVKIRGHIEEIEICTPSTYARYMNTPQGSIYGYLSDTWDGMSSRTLAAPMEPTVPGLFFVGAHGSRLSGFLPSYMSGDQAGKQIAGYVMGGDKP